jgi:hypothetical protein
MPRKFDESHASGGLYGPLQKKISRFNTIYLDSPGLTLTGGVTA